MGTFDYNDQNNNNADKHRKDKDSHSANDRTPNLLKDVEEFPHEVWSN